MTHKPDVSGFTRNEKFIMESLTSLKGDTENLKTRTTAIESGHGNRLTQLETEVAQLRAQKEHVEASTALEKQKGKEQLKIAVATGILALIGAILTAIFK